MASHGTFRLKPWVAEHFTIYSSRIGRSGPIYTAEADYPLTF
jgi:2'-5' RNA ligase